VVVDEFFSKEKAYEIIAQNTIDYQELILPDIQR